MAEQASQPWTVMRLLDWTKGFFAERNVDSPRLAAEMLLAHVVGCQRIELYARFDLQPTQEQLTTYRQLVRRAGNQEPVAYLVGSREFYSLRFAVSPDVLIPRPETELLVSLATDHVKSLSRPAYMWDVCTGTGCVAIATASQVETLTVLATDISEPALAVAQQNTADHGLADRVTCRRADLLTRPADCAEMPAFDVITANPPYVSTDYELPPVVAHEPTGALLAGIDGLDVIRPLIASAPDQLAVGGALILEFGLGQADAVRDLIVATKRFSEPTITRDHQDIERVAQAVRTA